MKTGIAIIITAIITPLYWFLPLAAEKDSIAILSQYIGSTAIISMGISQFLAARLTWTQAIFGGLDRVYILHKWIGIGAMIAVLLHDTIDAELERCQ